MIFEFDISTQKEEIDAKRAEPIEKHVWIDLPNNKVFIYTENDIPEHQ